MYLKDNEIPLEEPLHEAATISIFPSRPTVVKKLITITLNGGAANLPPEAFPSGNFMLL